MVMQALGYLLGGVPFKSVDMDLETHFKIKDGIIDIKNCSKNWEFDGI